MSAKYFIDYVARDPSASSGWRGLGCQLLEEIPAGRKTCSEGQEDFTLTEDIELHRGQNLVTVKASPAKPITGYTIIYPMGGERTFVHPMERK
jgi:hypothetical protein